jgi:hypothetical protein
MSSSDNPIQIGHSLGIHCLGLHLQVHLASNTISGRALVECSITAFRRSSSSEVADGLTNITACKRLTKAQVHRAKSSSQTSSEHTDSKRPRCKFVIILILHMDGSNTALSDPLAVVPVELALRILRMTLTTNTASGTASRWLQHGPFAPAQFLQSLHLVRPPPPNAVFVLLIYSLFLK